MQLRGNKSSAMDIELVSKCLGKKMLSPKKVDLTSVNSHLVCVLCGGYFVEATSITECLHTFCRSCIVKYVHRNQFCPICDVQLHHTKPWGDLRPDKIVQDLVYKLVPGLYQNEMARRREFYSRMRGQPDVEDGEERGALPHGARFYSQDDSISLSLEYYSGFEEEGEDDQNLESYRKFLKEKPRRYLQCPAAVTVKHLKKFLRMKYGIGVDSWVDILYNDESLPEDFSLIDVAYTYTWKRTSPMRFSYRIFSKVTIKAIGPEVDVQNSTLKEENTKKKQQPSLEQQRKQSEYLGNLNLNPTNAKLCKNQSQSKSKGSGDTPSHSKVKESHDNDKPIKSSNKQSQNVNRSILKNGNDYHGTSKNKNKSGWKKNKNKGNNSSSNNNNNSSMRNNNTANEKKPKKDENNGKTVTICEDDKIYHPNEDSSSSSHITVEQKANSKLSSSNDLGESVSESKIQQKSGSDLTCLEEETVDSFAARKFLRSKHKYDEKKEQKRVEEEVRGEKRRRSTSCIESYAEDKKRNSFKRRKSVAADEYSLRRESETKASKNFPDRIDDEESNENLKSEALRKVFVTKEKPDGNSKKEKDVDGWRKKRKKSKHHNSESKRRKSEDEPTSPSILTFASDPLKLKVKLNQNKPVIETPKEEPGKLKKKEIEKKEQIHEVTARNSEKEDKESGNRKEEREKRERNETREKVERRETREKDKKEYKEKVDKKETKEKVERRESRDRAAKKDDRDKGNKRETREKAERKEDKDRLEKKDTREKPDKKEDKERIDKKGSGEKADKKEGREKVDKKEAREKPDKKEDKDKVDKKESRDKVDKKEDREKADKKEAREKVEKKEDREKIDKKETREKVIKKEDKDKVDKNETREKAERKEDKEKVDKTETREQPDKKEDKDKVDKKETREKVDKTETREKVDKKEDKEKSDKKESREKIDNKEDTEKVDVKDIGEQTVKKEDSEKVDNQEDKEKLNEMEDKGKLDERKDPEKVVESKDNEEVDERKDKEKIDEMKNQENVVEKKDKEKVDEREGKEKVDEKEEKEQEKEKRRDNEEVEKINKKVSQEKIDIKEDKEKEEKERLEKMKDGKKEKQEREEKETKKPATTATAVTTTTISPLLPTTITITPVTIATTTTTSTAAAATTTISSTTITKTSLPPPSSSSSPDKERLLHLRQVRHKNANKTSVTEIISAPPSLTISKVDSSEPIPVKTPVNESKPSLEIVLVNPSENSKTKKKTEKKPDVQIKFVEPPDGDTPADIFEGVLDLSGKSSRTKDNPGSSNSESNLPSPAKETPMAAASHAVDSTTESESAESSRTFLEIAQTLVSRKMLTDNQFNPFEGPGESAAAAAAMRNLKTLSDTAVNILMAAQNKNFGNKSETSNRPPASASSPVSSKTTPPTTTSTKPGKDCDTGSGLKIPTFPIGRDRPIPPVPNLQEIRPRGRGRPRPLMSTPVSKPGQNQTVRQIPNPFAVLNRHSNQNQNALRSMLFPKPEEESTPSQTSKPKQIPPLQSIRPNYPPPLMSDANRFPYEALGPKMWSFNGVSNPRGFPNAVETNYRGMRNGDERFNPMRYNAPNTSMRRMEHMTKSIESVAAGLTARAASNPMVDAK